MTGPTGATAESRLVRRVRRDFPEYSVEVVLGQLRELAASSADPQLSSERVQAAMVLAARGDEELLTEAVDLARADWRDVLVAAGLADANWQHRLDDVLGPDPVEEA